MSEKPFSSDQTWLECIECGVRKDLIDERGFLCPKCGNLFDVEHNFYSLLDSFQSTKSLRDSFDERRGGASKKDLSSLRQSGVWRFKELIMPYLPESNIVSLAEGNVPIIPAGPHLKKWIGGDVDLWLILEGMTPTGSFKDYGGTVIISIAKTAGVKAVACASTGDTSAMASAYAAAAGIKCAVVLPKGKVTAVQLAQPLVHGAMVILLPGNFDDCMKVMKELVARGAYPVNSLNPARIEGHQATVFQIAQFFDWNMPEWIVVPVGNGSNASSVGKGSRLLLHLGLIKNAPRILGCQSAAANPLSRSWWPQCASEIAWNSNYKKVKVGETSATAARIGDPVSRKKVMREIIWSRGAMVTASEKRLNEAVAVCGKDGIFICPQTGIALAGIKSAVKNKWIDDGQTVVAVSTATGLKFTETAVRGLKSQMIEAEDCRTDTVAKIMKL